MTKSKTAEAEARRDQVARVLGITPDEARDLLITLPYSSIPEWIDVIHVVEWFETHGWSRGSASQDVRP